MDYTIGHTFWQTERLDDINDNGVLVEEVELHHQDNRKKMFARISEEGWINLMRNPETLSDIEDRDLWRVIAETTFNSQKPSEVIRWATPDEHYGYVLLFGITAEQCQEITDIENDDGEWGPAKEGEVKKWLAEVSK